MRNEIVTPFWKNALASLPASVRSRYAADIAAAERWELRIDAAVKGLTRARSAGAAAFRAGFFFDARERAMGLQVCGRNGVSSSSRSG